MFINFELVLNSLAPLANWLLPSNKDLVPFANVPVPSANSLLPFKSSPIALFINFEFSFKEFAPFNKVLLPSCKLPTPSCKFFVPLNIDLLPSFAEVIPFPISAAALLNLLPFDDNCDNPSANCSDPPDKSFNPACNLLAPVLEVSIACAISFKPPLCPWDIFNISWL